MPDRVPINEYIHALKAAKTFEGQVVFHREFAPAEPAYGQPRKSWPEPIGNLLAGMGIDRLYDHQVQSIDRIREGTHTVVATPTASGKTLIYALPVIEAVVQDASTCAMFIYPLKALAQDQFKAINRMSSFMPEYSGRKAKQ